MDNKLLFAFSIFIIACNNPQKSAPVQAKKDSAKENLTQAAKSIAGNFSDQTTLKFDSVRLSEFFLRYPLLSSFKENVKQFYTNRNFSFAWYDVNGQIEQAGNLYGRIKNLPDDGITTPVPYSKNLDSLVENPGMAGNEQRTEAEVMLTTLYFYFADKVWSGLDQQSTSALEWYLPRKKISYGLLLDSLLKNSDSSAFSNEPVYRQYHLLKSFLKKYQNIEKNGHWEILAAGNKSYHPGDSSAVIRQLKRKLFLTGDFTGDTTSLLFDSSFRQAVLKFQHRYGVKEDGIAGPAMIRELNVPISKRIETIMINMERSRWLPNNVTGEYIGINVPEFALHMYHNDSLLWNMDVVVGKAMSKTVIFSGNLQYVVFSPYWNVPYSIYKKEVLPGMQRNKNYLSSHHMEKSGNGVRQTPGPWNSLGQVKFLFPNSYNIYLHDTPAKTLFGEDRRDFSHGCIRVSDPLKLATYLLRTDKTWNEEAIKAAMQSGKEKYVTLAQKLPVFITYFTAWVDRQGNLNFRDDIYDRDSRLIEMMMSN